MSWNFLTYKINKTMWIFAIAFILLGVKLFHWSSQSWKDYKHWDEIIDSDIGSNAHANYITQFFFGMVFVASGVMILAVTL